MKKLVLSFLVFMTFVTYSNAQVGEVSDRKKVTSEKTIQTSEKQVKEVTHDGIKYYVFDGTWHTKMRNRYVFRTPPKGVKINFKPKGGEYVKMYGKKFYKCAGVFYKKLKENSYEVVRI